MIDEFLATRPPSQTLHLIITTRDKKKSDTTLLQIRSHLQKTLTAVYGPDNAIRTAQRRRIQLSGEILELTSLVSVRRLSQRLLERGEHIDALILNAGIGGWSGFNWPVAIWTVLTDVVQATTYPTFKLGYRGRVTASQIVDNADKDANTRTNTSTASSASSNGHPKSKAKNKNNPPPPQLGETFAANVFGHYMLSHYLMPLLKPKSSTPSLPGRIIWVSSIEAHARAFKLSDFQGLDSDISYESSKRLTDLLVLTSRLASTRRYVSSFLDCEASELVVGNGNGNALATAAKGQRDEDRETDTQPQMYLAHPGICGTSITGLPLIVHTFMLGAFYIARLLGSPWHCVSPYLGAVASVWLTLATPSTLDGLDGAEGKGKWGSSVDWIGGERILRTETEGWGWSGIVGEESDGGMRLNKGRPRGMTALTQESREEFEDVAIKAWREIEELRVEWEKRLDAVEGKM